jgi:hypothetical protein
MIAGDTHHTEDLRSILIIQQHLGASVNEPLSAVPGPAGKDAITECE